MTKPTLTAALLTASIRIALAADPATLSIVVFDDGLPVPDTQVLVDGAERGRTDAYGSMRLELPAGSRELVLRGDNRDLLRLDLQFAQGERAELIASLQADGPARVQYESSQGGQAGAALAPLAEAPVGPPGTVAGRVVSSEGGAGVGNARVFVSGTPLDVRTDAEGRFSIELPPGNYSISVIAAEFDSRTFDGVAVAAGETLTREIEITPAGVELPEFVVLEPFVEGSLASLVEERRDSAAVADFLGAEQISRSGDSDAAGALKRVTGLSLVDGKYVYVRGLGERYSSVLLNGAQIPSPDPTRRVVPLDLFPTDVIESVVVQKTYTGEMPGEFGGGTINLRTRNAPDGFFAKLGVTAGYLDGTTGEQGLTYVGGSRDWTGYDDFRGPQGALADFLGRGERLSTALPAAEREAIAESLALNSAYTPYQKRIEPSRGFTGGIGDSHDLGWGQVGALASVRYDDSWDITNEQRNTYTGRDITLNDSFDVSTTTRSIELSGFLNTFLSIGDDHTLRGNILLARVTDDEVQVQDGISDSQELVRYRLEWIENQLRSGQVGGEHRFPGFGGLEVDWLYTTSQASSYEPNRRSYAYQRNAAGQLSLNVGSSQLLQSFADLQDDADGYDVWLRLPMALLDERLQLTALAGLSDFQRDRDNRLRTFNYNGYFTLPPGGTLLPIEQILTPGNIGPGGIQIVESTQPTENYTAEQTVQGQYLGFDGEWRETWRLAAGVRREDDTLSLTPATIGGAPGQGTDNEDSNNLPYAMATWKYGDDGQVRAGYSRTLSRPDFRELSPSPFTDPQLDLLFFGNPDLRTTRIENYDIRWEYYFSSDENLGIALFRKEFTDPIEKSQLPGGSGAQGALINAPTAVLDGAEIDVYKRMGFVQDWDWLQRWTPGSMQWENLYVSGNYARIQSTVELEFPSECGGPPDGGFLTNCERPLQGQSPYVANLQLGYLNPDSGREYSLLFNRFGARIAQVGVDGAPDIYEQPFNQLDFVFQQRLWQDWSLKLRLRNLLDPEVRFLQGDQPTRTFSKGREILLTLEWKS